MGNSNITRSQETQSQPSVQYNFSDIIEETCITSSKTTFREFKSWFQTLQRSWKSDTCPDTVKSLKTQWPVPTVEAIFLPEFKIELTWKNEYSLLDYIDKGAYGEVYKVQKLETKAIFAAKVLQKSTVIAENCVVLAKEEAAIQRMIGHYPFIAGSSRCWQDRTALYILSDYIGGGELFLLCDKYKCLPEEVVKIYVGEIALAIDFLHNAGIVHRDLKESNVLLDNDGHAVLIDFGMAKWLPKGKRTNTICGTPEYIAPEILEGKSYGHEVDWWSLGILTCFMLTNKFPQKGRPVCLEENHQESPTTLPGTLPQDINISAAARDLLSRLLELNPSLRLHSIFNLQRIAFFMGINIQNYKLKKVSPFKLLEEINQNTSNVLTLPSKKILKKLSLSDKCDTFQEFDMSWRSLD